ncbi:response regulator transcription factor [Paenibacillus sp. YYML68]|uniref:response regulator transcription factor n=1 Tax=Paenibacillus sp. YYML68 TaxID=2909250 RepID=UPI00249225C3|nr:response regulator [Paenibacillus sp. YYML68]
MESYQILLADDEAALRFLLTETLAEEGYHIVEAADGKEAIKLLDQTKYDLVILDYMMPEKTGIEVCEWLRASSELNRDVPVVLLTAKAQEKDKERAIQAGVTRYIVKPFSPMLLLDVVQELIEASDTI